MSASGVAAGACFVDTGIGIGIGTGEGDDALVAVVRVRAPLRVCAMTHADQGATHVAGT